MTSKKAQIRYDGHGIQYRDQKSLFMTNSRITFDGTFTSFPNYLKRNLSLLAYTLSQNSIRIFIQPTIQPDSKAK